MLGSVIHRQSLTDNVKDTCVTVQYIDSCYSSFLSSPFCRGGIPQRPRRLAQGHSATKETGLRFGSWCSGTQISLILQPCILSHPLPDPLPDPGQLASLQGIFQGHICCSWAVSVGSSPEVVFSLHREGRSLPLNRLFSAGSRNRAPEG